MQVHPTAYKANRVPFNVPYVAPETSSNLQQALSNQKQCGNGPLGKACLDELKKIVGSSRVYLTPSCTAALEMSALLLGLAPGDEVIVPAYTFVSTACAFAIFGAKVRFADVCARTLNLDPLSVEPLLTKRTKAIVPVHYGGLGCDMSKLQQLAEQAEAVLLEDNAQGLTGSIYGPDGTSQALGSFGAASAVSFHETKNIGCGEGGALFVNREDWVARADVIQEKGTDRSRFLRGQVDKYTWVDLGSSYLLGELPAAMLLANLRRIDEVQRRRLQIWETYHQRLAKWAEDQGVQTPHIPAGYSHTAHLYYLIFPSLAERGHFTAHLDQQGVTGSYHYQPLHLSPMGKKFGGEIGDCPVTEKVAETLVRLPLFADMTDRQIDQVVEAVVSWKR